MFELSQLSRLLASSREQNHEIALTREEESAKRERARKERETREKGRKKEENLPYFTMNLPRNSIKHMFHQDLLVLSLRKMKEEGKRKEKQGKQGRKLMW